MIRINQELLQKIIGKIGSQATTYRKISAIAGPRHLATGALADSLGINIQKYYNEDELMKIAQLKGGETAQVIIKKGKVAEKVLRIGKLDDLKISEKALSPKYWLESGSNTVPYQWLYLLENSIRTEISRLLSENHGKKWWLGVKKDGKPVVKKEIKKEVKGRVNGEDNLKWVSAKRGAHEINYTNFSDLNSLIVNNWGVFKELKWPQHKIMTLFGDLKPIRNILAHNNPLGKDDISKIKTYTKDWFNTLEKIKNNK